jgi:hypothetical protein
MNNRGENIYKKRCLKIKRKQNIAVYSRRKNARSFNPCFKIIEIVNNIQII